MVLRQAFVFGIKQSLPSMVEYVPGSSIETGVKFGYENIRSRLEARSDTVKSVTIIFSASLKSAAALVMYFGFVILFMTARAKLIVVLRREFVVPSYLLNLST